MKGSYYLLSNNHFILSDHSTPQDVTSQAASHDPSTTENSTPPTVVHSPKHTNSYLGNVSSQLADFNDDPVVNSPKRTNNCLDNVSSQLSDFSDDPVKQSNEPIRLEDDLNDSDLLNQTHGSCDTTSRSHDPDCSVSHDLDLYDLDHDKSFDQNCDVSNDLDHGTSRDLDHDDFLSTSEMETSCEHNNTQLDDSVVVEDIDISNDDIDGVEDSKGFRYQFTFSNFTVKVCDGISALVVAATIVVSGTG